MNHSYVDVAYSTKDRDVGRYSERERSQRDRDYYESNRDKAGSIYNNVRDSVRNDVYNASRDTRRDVNNERENARNNVYNTSRDVRRDVNIERENNMTRYDLNRQAEKVSSYAENSKREYDNTKREYENIKRDYDADRPRRGGDDPYSTRDGGRRGGDDRYDHRKTGGVGEYSRDAGDRDIENGERDWRRSERNQAASKVKESSSTGYSNNVHGGKNYVPSKAQIAAYNGKDEDASYKRDRPRDENTGPNSGTPVGNPVNKRGDAYNSSYGGDTSQARGERGVRNHGQYRDSRSNREATDGSAMGGVGYDKRDYRPEEKRRDYADEDKRRDRTEEERRRDTAGYDRGDRAEKDRPTNRYDDQKKDSEKADYDRVGYRDGDRSRDMSKEQARDIGRDWNSKNYNNGDKRTDNGGSNGKADEDHRDHQNRNTNYGDAPVAKDNYNNDKYKSNEDGGVRSNHKNNEDSKLVTDSTSKDNEEKTSKTEDNKTTDRNGQPMNGDTYRGNTDAANKGMVGRAKETGGDRSRDIPADRASRKEQEKFPSVRRRHYDHMNILDALQDKIATQLRENGIAETRVPMLSAKVAQAVRDDVMDASLSASPQVSEQLRSAIHSHLDPLLYNKSHVTDLSNTQRPSDASHLANMLLIRLGQVHEEAESCKASADDAVKSSRKGYTPREEPDRSILVYIKEGLEQQKTENSILQEKLKNAHKVLQESEAEREKNLKEVQELSAENWQLSRDLREAESDRESLIAKVKELQFDYELLDKAYLDLKADNTKLKKLLSESETNNRSISTELSQLQSDKARLQVLLDQKEKEILHLRDPDKEMLHSVKILTDEVTLLRTQTRRLNEEKGLLKSRSQKTESSLEESQKTRNKLTIERDALVRENQELKQRYWKLSTTTPQARTLPDIMLGKNGPASSRATSRAPSRVPSRAYRSNQESRVNTARGEDAAKTQ